MGKLHRDDLPIDDETDLEFQDAKTRFVDDDTLKRAQAAGIKSLAYKIYSKQEHEEADSRGFHGIITDHLEYFFPAKPT